MAKEKILLKYNRSNKLQQPVVQDEKVRHQVYHHVVLQQLLYEIIEKQIQKQLQQHHRHPQQYQQLQNRRKNVVDEEEWLQLVLLVFHRVIIVDEVL